MTIRVVLVYFISGAKVRNPAAAQALIKPPGQADWGFISA